MKNLELTSIFFEAIAREREAMRAGKRPTREMAFKYVDGPPDCGIFHTGADGWDAIWKLTDSAMRSGKIALRADRNETMRLLAKTLMRKFIEEALDLNESNVARAISETCKIARRGFKTQTHFLPCHLSTQAELVGVRLGEVRFISRNEAKIALREALRAERKHGLKLTKSDRTYVHQAVDHYRGFRWFAEVTVKDCSPNRSKAIALAAATSALDLLQLLIGPRHSHRMQMSGSPSHFERLASIARDEENGRVSFSAGWTLLGEGLPEGWTSQILEGDGQDGLDQAGILLESKLNPDLKRPLSERLLDAAQWFGEGIRDPSPSTRIIKYVTAIERLTLTKKVEDIANSVSDRVAALVTGLIGGKSFQEHKAGFKKVYSLRSELAHGSTSPNDPKVGALLGKASDYAEHALARALYNWPRSKLIDPKFTPASLEIWFNDLVAWVSTSRGEAAAVLSE